MNLGEMVQMGLDRLGVRATDTTVVRMLKANANAEYDAIKRKRQWDWLEKWADPPIAITGTSTRIALPSDCRGVKYLFLNGYGVLTWKMSPLREIQGGIPSVASRGIPVNWDTVAGSLVLNPYSSIAGTLDMLYYRIIPQMVLNSDEPVFAADYHGIIADGMLARMSSEDSYDESIARQARRDRDEGLADMIFTAAQAQPAPMQLGYLEGEN